nr:reverse transcriptase domain-containing protein [Tanacetum cinerariifolium]
MTKQGNFNQRNLQVKKTHSDLQTKKQQSHYDNHKHGRSTACSLYHPHQTVPETDLTEPPPAPLRNKGFDLEVDNLALEGVAPELAPSDFVFQNYKTLATLIQEETKKRSSQSLQAQLNFDPEYEASPLRHRKERRERDSRRPPEHRWIRKVAKGIPLEFYSKEEEDPPVATMIDNRTMAEMFRAPTEGYAEEIIVPPILTEQFELKHSLISMMTSKQFFGLKKDNPHDHIRCLRNEISNFEQKFGESFHEAWDRYKDLLRACPHHGFTELHQLNTFYNALNPTDQDSLNATAGGNLLERSTQDVLTIIENKSKVCNSRSKSIASQVKICDTNSSSEIAKLTHAVNEQTSTMITAMTAMLRQFQATPPPASVKAVEETCVTCGGAHPYYQCLAAGGKTFPEFRDNIQEYGSAAAANYNQELDDRSISRPVGVAEDVYVKVGSFHFPADFVVVDFDADSRVPLILGRSFLKTGRALIDVFEGELTLRVGKEAITFNLDQTSRYSANYNNMTAKRIDVIDMACEEYSQEVLGFSDVTASGNPTPIVSTTSPTLTLFGDSDFLLFEEANAFLGLEDDPDSPELDPSYYDPKGDIQMLEAILNTNTIKSSVDEPPEVELKDLPPHLEYVFLEGDNKLPVIIAKELGEDPWVSPVHCVPKKGGFTIVKNEENELIPTRLVTGWRTMEVFMDDFSVFGNSLETYLSRLDKMLQRDMMDSFLRMNTASPSSSGTLPSNTVTNPKSDLKAITTRSGVSYDGPSISPPVVENAPEATKDTVIPTNNGNTEDVQPQPNLQASIPYPSRRNDERNREKAKDQIEKFYQLFKDMSFEISFTDALILMPKFASTLKALISNKEKLSEMARTPLNEHCSTVLLKKLPEKLGDPGMFLIPCDFSRMAKCLALADLGASINLMPYSVWKKLSLPDLTPTCMTLELADRSISRPVGVADDVTIDVIDMACEEYSQEVLGFSDVTTSGNPTPSNDLIVSTTSPTLTPFGDSDFLLFEEANAFLAILNSDPAPSLPNHEQSVPSFTNELKACEAKTIKSSVDKPPEVKLKDLPPHIEYAFLEGDNKLLVIIAKELGDEEKAALIKVLKSHKRAIAWKLSDIQGINPEFCTHKIIMEEDYKPVVQHQRRVNPKIHDVIKKEVEKLLNAGLIYPISNSPWVSPVHCVPKKGGFTVVKNEENELIPTR